MARSGALAVLVAGPRAAARLVLVAPEGGNQVGRGPVGRGPEGGNRVGRGPVGRGQAERAPAVNAAGRVAAPPAAVLPALVTVVQLPATAVRPRAAPTAGLAAVVPLPPAHTVTPAARPRLRPGGIPIPGAPGIGAPGRNLTGARFQVAGPRHSGPRRRETVVAARRTVGGTGRRPDVTAQRFRGGTALEPAERTKPKTSLIPDPFRARSVAQPRSVATSGRERLERRARSRPAVLRWAQVAGAGDSRGLRALRVRPPVAGRPRSAATNGRCRPGEAPVVRASLSVAADVRPSPRAGVVLQTPDVSSGATRSRAARPSGNCLPRTGGRCTKSG